MILCRVNAEAMRAALERASTAIPPRSPMPILQCALLRMDKKLSVAATDLDTWVETGVEAEVITPGKVAVDLKRLMGIFGALSTTQSVELCADEVPGTILVQQGRHKTRLLTLHADDFPRAPPAPAQKDALVVGGPELAAAAHLVLPYIATDKSKREALMGARLRWNGNVFYLSATDGRNLVHVVLPQPALYSRPPAWSGDAVVPRLGVAALAASGQERVRIFRDAHRIQVDAADTSHVSRLIAGEYPDIETGILSLITQCRTQFRGRAEDVLHALERQCVTDSASKVEAHLTVRKKALSINSTGRNTSIATEELDFAVKGPDVSVIVPVNLTVGLLRTVAAVSPGQDVVVHIQDDHSPVHLLTESNHGMAIHTVTANIHPAAARQRAA